MSELTCVDLNGKKLKPRELTFREVEQVLESLVNPETHLLELSNPDEPIPAEAVALSVGIETDDLYDLTPTQGKQLLEEVKKKNPFLAQTVETLASAAVAMMTTQDMEKVQEVVNKVSDQPSTTSEDLHAS